MKSCLFACLLFLVSFGAYAQKGTETKVNDNDKRRLSRQETRFIANQLDSITRNLNRMILYEKELRQRNYYLNEKTALVNELISVVRSLQQSLDVLDLRESDVKSMFGKASFRSPALCVYEIETYKSNCPFIQITFHLHHQSVTRLEYKITDCQRWK